MTSTLNSAIQSVWDRSADASHVAAETVEHYYLEAADGQGVEIDAHATESSALIGGRGDDTLSGGTADDILIGREGDDTLDGG
ncbi:hypothetical protein HER21_42425, partial [Pseudomonas sp. BGM005]|nr:hypothetical protein [Pseudomonas sp. BG5]